jgi:hypothetical protein
MRGGRGAEGGERRGGVQASGKIANEGDHGGVPKAVKAEEIHLLQGLLAGPFFDGHAIGGDKDAGAVIAEMTVHEDLLIRIFVEKREELNHLFIGGRGPSTDGNMDETQAQGLGLLVFPGDFFGVFAAKIDDGGDAEFFKLGETFGFRLRTAVKMIVDSAAVGNKGDAKFLAVGRMHFGGGSGRRSLLCAKMRRPKEEKTQDEEKPIPFHNGLDAKIVAGDGKK